MSEKKTTLNKSFSRVTKKAKNENQKKSNFFLISLFLVFFLWKPFVYFNVVFFWESESFTLRKLERSRQVVFSTIAIEYVSMG